MKDFNHSMEILKQTKKCSDEMLAEVNEKQAFGEAFEDAIDALERQIPKESYKDTCPERTLHKCPSCRYIFVTEYADGSLCAGRKSRYCPECGQAMEW
jgi:hypothetical protein